MSVTSQAVSERTRVCPRQATATYAGSATFMKQLTTVAVSAIAYVKDVFPEDSYAVEQFGGLRLRVLKLQCRDELAQFVSTALTQAFDAFDNKYLHQLVLCFYESECELENLIEYHVFEYKYSSEGMSMAVRCEGPGRAQASKFTIENVTEETVQLLRACMKFMGSCSARPKSYDVSLRLYYNEDAPEGYQAPGFAAGEERLPPLALARDATRLGCVATPFHTLTMHSFQRETKQSSLEAIASLNSPILTQHEPDEFEGEAMDEGSTREAPALGAVRCTCAKADYEPGAMLSCQFCGTLQHAACYGLRVLHAGTAAARVPCCCACAEEDPTRVPSDPTLLNMPFKQRECTSIFRRTLWWLRERGAVSARELSERFELAPLSAHKLMRLLHSYGILHLADLSAPCAVQAGRLLPVTEKFFQSAEPLVERLIEESLSQEGLAGPRSPVLQLEKMSLQNAATVCTPAEPEQAGAGAEAGAGAGDGDAAALERYRAALGRSPAPRGPAPPPPAPPAKRRIRHNIGLRSKKAKTTCG